jgi:hypothetical protein
MSIQWLHQENNFPSERLLNYHSFCNFLTNQHHEILLHIFLYRLFERNHESLVRNAISMESLNDYFDSMEKFEDEQDSCNVDIVVTDDKKCNQSDKLSSQIVELEDKFATCSPLNSSASSSSSSYYSFSSYIITVKDKNQKMDLFNKNKIHPF